MQEVDLELNVFEPSEHVLLYDLDLEEHGQALLVVVQDLVQVDADHEHGALVSIFAELFDLILIKLVLNVLDHCEHVTLISFNQVLVDGLRTVLLNHDVLSLEELLALDSLLQRLS